MQRLLVLFILIISFSVAQAKKPEYLRNLSLEWEPIEFAKSYEIEITNSKHKSKKVYKSSTVSWSGNLTPGNYSMRIRSRDYRGVPGVWSDAQEFSVGLEPVMIISPKPSAKLKGTELDEQKVTFSWQAIDIADKYHISIYNEKNEVIHEDETSKTQVNFELPVANKYSWKIYAIDDEGNQSDAVAVNDFFIYGPKISKPKVNKPDSEFVRNLKWDAPEKATSYDYNLLRLDKTSKKWSKVESAQNYPNSEISFKPEWRGGDYKILLRANAPNRIPSDVVSETFNVFEGDRSPASEITHTIRKSIERIEGWYGIASYLITEINYQTTTDTNEYDSSRFDAIGGTGRLGLGFSQKDTAWGFLSIIDLSGFTTDAGTTTYASSEFNSVYKKRINDYSEYRIQLGMFYKELPLVIPNVTNLAESSYQQSKYAGPHIAGEYWFSLTPKLGLQLNYHYYSSMLGLQSPNGMGIVSTPSTQFGILGSYRMNEKFTGLMGYSFRTDRVQFNSSFGGQHQIELTGHYLNFFAEYDF